MQVNPSALILPMEPQPDCVDEFGMLVFTGLLGEMTWGVKAICDRCPVQPGERVPHGDKTLLVRTVEARRVESITEEEAEQCGYEAFYLPPYVAGGEIIGPDGADARDVLVRDMGDAKWCWLLKGEVVT